MKWKRCGSCLAVLGMALAMSARAQSSDETPVPTIREDDRPAPVDWGFGPGVRPKDTALRAVQEMTTAPAAAPGGGPDAQTKGVFAAPVTWPLIPLHTVLLPDGRVMSYGTGQNGGQGASGVYDVWNPALGTDTTAHTVLPNTTSTDIFCSGLSVMAASGEVLIVGGDQTINGQRNYSNDRATIFHPRTNAITTDAPMTYARWYPTIVALPTGEMLVVGGREDKLPDVPVTTPEVFTQNVGWRTLWGATSDAAFGSVKAAWYYTRAVPAPNGMVFVLGYDGKMYYLDPAGAGAITQLPQQTLGATYAMPAVMFRPGMILSVRNNRKVMIVDLNGLEPVVTPTADLDQERTWSTPTVMADGKVLVSGGSAVSNQLIGVAYAAAIWDPASGQWTLGANAVKPRLYHSIAMLLPDGSVLTGGGGAPGPTKELNGEIYYPGYLYDASGQPAARPSIVAAPALLQLHLNQQFAATVGSATPISRVTLARTGAVTHTFDSGQRFLDLLFTQAGQTLTITLPTVDPNVIVPGCYMLFVLDQAGVPSVAAIVLVTA